jgi:hypothetical protein
VPVWAIVERVAYDRWADGDAAEPPLVESGFGSAVAAAQRAEELEAS